MPILGLLPPNPQFFHKSAALQAVHSMSAYQPSRNPQTVSLVNKLFAVFITLTPSESFKFARIFLLQRRCILPACLLTQYRISTRLTWRPGKIPGGQVDSVDVGERLQQPVSGADGSIRVLPQHRYGNGVGTVRDVEVLRPDRSQVQNFGIGVEGLVAVSVSVLRKNVSARSRSQNILEAETLVSASLKTEIPVFVSRIRSQSQY